MLIKLYGFLSRLVFPWYLKHLIPKRLKKGKEDPQRLKERYGEATRARPEGALIWVHGASVGESLSALPLIERLQEVYPHLSFLVTTGTLTSARLLETRLPERAFHQFIPFDTPQAAQKFLEFWRPQVALWIESELWPNLIFATKKRDIPLILVNGRMSKRTYERWRTFKGSSQGLFSQFDLCLVQSEDQAQKFKELGAPAVKVAGNLKYTASSLKYDENALEDLKKALKQRTYWLAASTHEGEEKRIQEAHEILKETFPDLLTIVAPRHPDRALKIQEELGKERASLRSHDLFPPEKADFYLVNTLGELGLFYRLCPVSFVGGSLVPIGGHNLIEPAQLGSLILHGPYMHKTQEMRDLFHKNEAALEITNAEELAAWVAVLLQNPEKRSSYTHKAQHLVQEEKQVLEKVLSALASFIK